jgi:hypothetical protein
MPEDDAQGVDLGHFSRGELDEFDGPRVCGESLRGKGESWEEFKDGRRREVASMGKDVN